MNIRKDFESAATYLHRLFGIGETFNRLATEEWSHLKNREDFDRVYQLDQPRRRMFENLYGDGRDMAYYMSSHLRSFNSVADFPSMTAFVDSFERNWCASIEDHRQRSTALQQYVDEPGTPWAVRQMIGIWETQVELLEAVNETVTLLKQTDIYRVERGEMKVTDVNKPNLHVGVFGNVTAGKVNIGSTDNSTTVHISAHQVFADIRDALKNAAILPEEQRTLDGFVDAMESEVGKPTFIRRYQDFIAAGANHMSILAPFIPALTALFGGGS